LVSEVLTDSSSFIESVVIMILHVPRVLTAQELSQLQRWLNVDAAGDWSDGRVTAGTQSGQTKRNRQLPETSRVAQQASHVVAQAFSRNPLFVTGALPKKVYPPLFNCYAGAANHFGKHIDNAVRTEAATARHVRTDISCTLFLSDPASYEGGELVIQDTFGQQTIKLAAGDAVIYPGTSVHQVTPVTKGERLASFFWIESMVRRDDQRRLLYDMDMAILALRQKNHQTDPQAADGEEVVQLTGCYHNLLRMWCDV
jgi:PKHD-type hydroxylase